VNAINIEILRALAKLAHEFERDKAERRNSMPICRIEAPPGISGEAKRIMMQKITAAIDEGYPNVGDTLVFLLEDRADNVMLNGRLQSENPKIAAFVKDAGA
jgi:hypothetical protein